MEKQDSLKKWLNGLEVVDVKTMDEEDRCCAICHEDFCGGDAADIEQQKDGAIETTKGGKKGEDGVSKIDEKEMQEHPVRVKPCNHIFGKECLKSWLSPGPEGGNSETCPTCRATIFSRQAAEDDSDWEDGWFSVPLVFS